MTETSRHAGAVRATLTGIAEALVGAGPPRSLPTGLSLEGHTALVTGASRGLGHAIAGQLAERGASVVLPCRSLLDETAQAISARAGHDRVRVDPVDLADLATVDGLVDRLARDRVVLDRVVLNAGVVPASARRTVDGLDLMFQVNFLASVRLVDRLLATDLLAPPDGGLLPRIVIVGSEAHRSSPDLDLDHLGRVEPYGTAQVMRWYGWSKLHVHTWAVELSRRLAGRAEVHHLCPGAIASEIAREAPSWSRPVLRAVMRLAFQSPETAARPAVWLTASPEVAGRTGVYLHLRVEKDPDPRAIDPSRGARLWDAAHGRLEALRGPPDAPRDSG